MRVSVRLFSIGVTTLLFFASSPVQAQEVLPAGYERMMGADVEHVLILDHKDRWTDNHSAITFGHPLVSGHRPVDLEVVDFDPHPTTKEGYDAGHRISVVEVPNEGLMAAQNWVMALGENEGGIESILVPGNDTVTGRPLPNFRPTDIELYYRHSPIDGDFVEATYAIIAVENSGKHYAAWDWIKPMPLNAFMDKLA